MRSPVTGPPTRSSAPAGKVSARPKPASCPGCPGALITVSGAAAPATATTAPARKRNAPRPSVSSIPAAPGGFPASSLARTRLPGSAAPDRDTPRCP